MIDEEIKDLKERVLRLELHVSKIDPSVYTKNIFPSESVEDACVKR